MSATFCNASAVVPACSRGLLLCAGLAVLLHAAALFSPWRMDSIMPALPQEQSVEVELEAAPPEAVLPEILAPEPVDIPPLPDSEPPMPLPDPEPVPEPVPPPKPVPVVKKAKPHKATPRQPTPKAPKVQSVPAIREQESPRPVLRSPEPLPAFKNRKPAYPKLARQRGQEGTVLLRVHVDPAGSVLDMEIVRSSGHTLLDDAAVTALRRWRFKPAESDGTKVSGYVLVPVEFRLQ